MAFNLGRVTDCESRLQRDFVEFARQWADVREHWQDQRRVQFEKDHLTTLGPSLNRFAAALRDFSDTVRKADRALQEDSQSLND
ncbi:hypothetical protein K227x_62750 [Rubripirellula lacrimiformis]|uniref:Uncharacterized protein n=1 Tax=Rubripirellula lacrimiformis TaxID=1930273 RepID=A0A517NL32_9BACT|nr:hypothetical protein [Rubripirellula lacrimiformis]QDT07846.1 hypothetical protein K227x_62750 [Rubripirellula lacrimiformis]